MARPTKDIAKAIKAGQARAKAALAKRKNQLRKREMALARPSEPSRRRAPVVSAIPARLQMAAGSLGNNGTLVAEGDSWFDYPGNDVLSMLEDEHAYDVEAVAHRGDRVEGMAYDDGQLLDFSRRLEKVIRKGITPAAILLSGGGNDIAGEEFEMLLDHKGSMKPGLNKLVVEGILQQRILLSYTTIISAVTKICQERVGRPIRILVHGYDHPIPDGRGYLGGFWILPGPWLRPGFYKKGYRDLRENTRIIGGLIDQFNDMIASLPTITGFGHVRYVNLRGCLSAPNYKDVWDNELHPTERGFSLVADRFAAAITQP